MHCLEFNVLENWRGNQTTCNQQDFVTLSKCKKRNENILNGLLTWIIIKTFT